jgi:hypothetical protein
VGQKCHDACQLEEGMAGDGRDWAEMQRPQEPRYWLCAREEPVSYIAGCFCVVSFLDFLCVLLLFE